MWTLIVFTRWPEPGRTKTRLIPAFGADGAARIHRQMIAHTVRAARALPCDASVAVALADAPAHVAMTELFDAGWRTFAQDGEDLGQRMAGAIDFALSDAPDCDRVILVGVDCPDYSAALFSDAAQALLQNDVVFAPTEDGGYGLVGVNRRCWNHDIRHAIFSGIAWGGTDVMTVTESRLRQLIGSKRESSIRVAKLPTIWDIDTPTDVARAVSVGVLKENEI
jgi:uncharacterized protein